MGYRKSDRESSRDALHPTKLTPETQTTASLHGHERRRFRTRFKLGALDTRWIRLFPPPGRPGGYYDDP